MASLLLSCLACTTHNGANSLAPCLVFVKRASTGAIRMCCFASFAPVAVRLRLLLLPLALQASEGVAVTCKTCSRQLAFTWLRPSGGPRLLH